MTELTQIDWPSTLSSPRGRIARRPFRIAMAGIIVLNVLLLLVLPSQLRVLGNLLHAALLYPAFCLLAQRFRDFGRTGWLAAAPAGLLGLAFVLAAAGLAFFRADPAQGDGLMMTSGLLMLAGLIVTLIFLAWAGTAPGASPEATRAPAQA